MNLTRTQQLILTTISEFVAANGVAPTVREIGEITKRSPATIAAHLAALRLKGRITSKAGCPRTIQVKSG